MSNQFANLKNLSSLSSKNDRDHREEFEIHNCYIAGNFNSLLQSFYIRNNTANDIIVIDRSNLPRIVCSEPSEEIHSDIVIDIRRDLENLDISDRQRPTNLKVLDPNLVGIIKQVKLRCEGNPSAYRTFHRRYRIPALTEKELHNGYYHSATDLLFCSFDLYPNKFPLHPYSTKGIEEGVLKASIEKYESNFNAETIVINVNDSKLQYVYHASPTGVRILKTTFDPNKPPSVIVTQPKIYDERYLDVPPDGHITETLSCSLDQAGEKFNIFINFQEAKICAHKLRKPELVTETLKSQSDLNKEQIRAISTAQELGSMDTKFRYENIVTRNKEATEAIKTLGLIAASIGALAGVYKLIR